MVTSPQDREALFDDLAQDYDQLSKWGERFLLRRLRRRLLWGVKGKVLEIGVGTGLNFPYYPKDIQLFGIDVSEGMLDEAQYKVESFDLNAHLNVMDAEALMFEDDSFDTVLSTLTLCSMNHPSQVISEMARVCKPEGKLLFLEHGRSHYGWINKFLDRRADIHLEDFGCQLNLDIESIVRDSGLQIDGVSSHYFGMVKLFMSNHKSTLLKQE